MPQSEPTTLAPPAATGFAFQPIDIRKVARQATWCEVQLHSFTKQFDAAMDKRIKVVLEPFMTFPGWVADLENRFEARAK